MVWPQVVMESAPVGSEPTKNRVRVPVSQCSKPAAMNPNFGQWRKFFANQTSMPPTPRAAIGDIRSQRPMRARSESERFFPHRPSVRPHRQAGSRDCQNFSRTANRHQNPSPDPNFLPAVRSSPEMKVRRWRELVHRLVRQPEVLRASERQACASEIPHSRFRSGRQQVAEVREARRHHRFRKTGSSPDCRYRSGCSAQGLHL